MTYTTNLKEFPSTRYQGSKRKILPWIQQAFDELEFDSVLDAFGGSGSVSYLLKKMGKSVTYNDKLKFNYIIGKSIIENNLVTLTEEDIYYLTTYHDYSYSFFIDKNFKNIYYLPEENQWLDMVLTNIHLMNGYNNIILEYKKALAYYCLFQSCLVKRPFNLFHRKNLSLRTADVKRNFGNKSTWDKSFIEHFKNFAIEVNNVIFSSTKACKSISTSVFDIPKQNYDLVYLDPPYLKKGSRNESSDYLKVYHFLEGLANYSQWSDLIDYSSANLRFKQEAYSNDFKIKDISKAYEQIFQQFEESTIVMSYKQNGVPSIDFLEKLMRKYKSKVAIKSMHYKYALNKQNGDAVNNREVLIIGE